VSLTFVINFALPGDPARVVAGPQARPADVARIRAQIGLDRPLGVQYLWFLRRLVHLGPAAMDPKDKAHASCSAFGRVHLDLGMSYQQRKPVAKLLGDKLPASLILASAAMLVQLSVGAGRSSIAGWWSRRSSGSARPRSSLRLACSGCSPTG